MSNLTQREHEFEAFMREVNMIVEAHIGLGCGHLPDFNYRDCFDSGMTPEATAEDFLDNLEEEF